MAWYAHRAALVAVDLGAQSCRVSLLRWGASQIEVIHRFSNAPISTDTGLRWDMQSIFEGVKAGLHLCADAAPEGIASIGVDGWAVDYVRLGSNGSLLGNPFCYRDERTAKAAAEVHRLIPPYRLYSMTGIQLLSLNTLYQLYADKLAGLDPRSRWLNIPEYVTHILGGKMVSEYTNATHTQMVKLGTKEWCEEIFEATGLDQSAAPQIVPTGCVVGTVGAPLSTLSAFRGTRLIVPACHDTASAVAAVPATGNDWAFISSGTWSLVGTVLDSPCVTEEARRMNFTNLGGVGGTTCFLKNVNGMWLLRQCMAEWAKDIDWTVPELIALLKTKPDQISFAHAGPGSSLHLAAELFQTMTGTKMNGVAYRGAPPALNDVMAGHVSLMFADMGTVVAQITAGKVRALGVTSTTRVPFTSATSTDRPSRADNAGFGEQFHPVGALVSFLFDDADLCNELRL